MTRTTLMRSSVSFYSFPTMSSLSNKRHFAGRRGEFKKKRYEKKVQRPKARGELVYGFHPVCLCVSSLSFHMPDLSPFL